MMIGIGHEKGFCDVRNALFMMWGNSTGVSLIYGNYSSYKIINCTFLYTHYTSIKNLV